VNYDIKLELKKLKFIYYFFIKSRIDHLIYYFFCKYKFDNTFLNSIPNKIVSEKLFEEYHSKFKNKNSNYSSIWQNVLSHNYNGVYDSLNNLNKSKFNEILNNFFQEKAIRGAEDGDLFKKLNFEVSHKYLLITGIQKLSEYLGYNDLTNPYQFYEKYNQYISIKDIYNELSKDLPIKEIPNIGSPYGLKIQSGVINYRFIESIYFNLELKNFIFNQKNLINKKLRILEIGGGSGMNILVTINFLKDYIEKIYLIDLPEMLLFQEYFLRCALDDKDLKKIVFIPSDQFVNMKLKYNILINKDSLPEIPKPISDLYLNNFSKNEGCYFFSLNQESRLKDQMPVHELVKDYKNISRVSRSYFPLKKGYVSEVYISKSQK